jgi:hypothetical protein
MSIGVSEYVPILPVSQFKTPEQAVQHYSPVRVFLTALKYY